MKKRHATKDYSNKATKPPVTKRSPSPPPESGLYVVTRAPVVPVLLTCAPPGPLAGGFQPFPVPLRPYLPALIAGWESGS